MPFPSLVHFFGSPKSLKKPLKKHAFSYPDFVIVKKMMLMTDNHSSSHLSSWLAAWVRARARPSLQHRRDSVSTALLSQPKYIEEFVKKSSEKKRLIFRRGHSQDQKSVSGEKEETEFVGHRVSSKCSKTGRNWPQIRVFLVAFKMENWLNFG